MLPGFETLRAKNLEQGKLQTDVLDVVGQQMTDGFTTLIEAVVKAGNTDLLPVAHRCAPARPLGPARRRTSDSDVMMMRPQSPPHRDLPS